MALVYRALTPSNTEANMAFEIDPETAELIRQLNLEDEAIKQDQEYAASLAAALNSDTAYLESIVAAEEAAAQDRIAAEMLARGEELPPPTAAQMRLGGALVTEPDVASGLVEAVLSNTSDSSNPSLPSPPPEAIHRAIQHQDESISDSTHGQDIEQSPPAVDEDIVLPTGKGKAREEDTPHVERRRLPTDLLSPYMEAARVKATQHDKVAAEMLERGEELPPLTSAQQRVMNPDLFTQSSSSVTSADEHETSIDEVLSLESFCNPNVFRASVASTSFEGNMASGPSVDRTKTVQCIVCHDLLVYNNAFQAPCDHNYCPACIVKLVEKSVQDESTFPARCCNTTMTINSLQPHLSPTLCATLRYKQAEFSTAAKNRVYCFQSTCTAFLGSSEGNTDIPIICPKCCLCTCPKCKLAEHPGKACEATAQK
ncbi:hypothetical protein BDN70DRAFT_837862 [Pholiota conissans]|uniref:RING-type domain-containing protein n=1 Tax=Pholiota conissans TaxID=109636 RepID=A0A9P6CZ93_9AGAR|nr:hypothetical protein BDN70DRAFT_837862 [Pholiota conissans]